MCRPDAHSALNEGPCAIKTLDKGLATTLIILDLSLLSTWVCHCLSPSKWNIGFLYNDKEHRQRESDLIEQKTNTVETLSRNQFSQWCMNSRCGLGYDPLLSLFSRYRERGDRQQPWIRRSSWSRGGSLGWLCSRRSSSRERTVNSRLSARTFWTETSERFAPLRWRTARKCNLWMFRVHSAKGEAGRIYDCHV